MCKQQQISSIPSSIMKKNPTGTIVTLLLSDARNTNEKRCEGYMAIKAQTMSMSKSFSVHQDNKPLNQSCFSMLFFPQSRRWVHLGYWKPVCSKAKSRTLLWKQKGLTAWEPPRSRLFCPYSACSLHPHRGRAPRSLHRTEQSKKIQSWFRASTSSEI